MTLLRVEFISLPQLSLPAFTSYSLLSSNIQHVYLFMAYLSQLDHKLHVSPSPSTQQAFSKQLLGD